MGSHFRAIASNNDDGLQSTGSFEFESVKENENENLNESEFESLSESHEAVR